jgi:formate-dependent nitrite reductase membrane component NrfD
MDSVIGAILVLLGIAAVAVAGAGYLIERQREEIEREVRIRCYA